MKYALILLVAIPLILGCGQRSGNNPEGVLGGGTNGYGSFGTDLSTGTSPDIILGAWHQDITGNAFNVVTFRDNGTIKVDIYNGDLHQAVNGTYYLSGSNIDLSVEGWQSGSGTISVNGNTMLIRLDNGTITLQKTS